jgi:predicted nucleic acid-binding protein
MSYSVDVNVLLYASDQANPRYDRALQFLLNRASDPELFCIAWSTLMGYIRISTHPSIFSHPLSPEEALENVESLLNQPRVRVLSEDDGFLVIWFRTLTLPLYFCSMALERFILPILILKNLNS